MSHSLQFLGRLQEMQHALGQMKAVLPDVLQQSSLRTKLFGLMTFSTRPEFDAFIVQVCEAHDMLPPVEDEGDDSEALDAKDAEINAMYGEEAMQEFVDESYSRTADGKWRKK